MEKVINNGSYVNTKNIELLSPLYVAVSNNNNEVVPVLIQADADVNIRIGGKSLLDIAIENRNFEIIGYLVKAGIEFTAVYRYKNTPHLNHWYEDYTYLMWAVEDGDAELLEHFINLGVDINRVIFGETPIMLAIRKKNMPIIDILINAGAILEREPKAGIGSALTRAIGGKDQEIINRILEENPLVTNEDLSSAIIWDANIETIKIILARIPEIDRPRLPLVEAVLRREMEIIHLLLENGADVNYYNREGVTPLMMASLINVDICELLINAGADLSLKADYRSNQRWTALHFAAHGDGPYWPYSYRSPNAKPFSPKIEIVKLLVRAGADVNSAADGLSWWSFRMIKVTPLMLTDNEEVIRELLQAGADVNAQDGDGRTALMYSVYFYKSIEQARLLIEAGADINAVNVRGRNAFMFAQAVKDNEEVINYLITAGADTSIIDVLPDEYREYGSDYNYYFYITENFYSSDH